MSFKIFPNVHSIKTADYAQKINQLLNQNIAVLALAAIIIFIGLLVINGDTSSRQK